MSSKKQLLYIQLEKLGFSCNKNSRYTISMLENIKNTLQQNTLQGDYDKLHILFTKLSNDSADQKKQIEDQLRCIDVFGKINNDNKDSYDEHLSILQKSVEFNEKDIINLKNRVADSIFMLSRQSSKCRALEYDNKQIKINDNISTAKLENSEKVIRQMKIIYNDTYLQGVEENDRKLKNQIALAKRKLDNTKKKLKYNFNQKLKKMNDIKNLKPPSYVESIIN